LSSIIDITDHSHRLECFALLHPIFAPEKMSHVAIYNDPIPLKQSLQSQCLLTSFQYVILFSQLVLDSESEWQIAWSGELSKSQTDDEARIIEINRGWRTDIFLSGISNGLDLFWLWYLLRSWKKKKTDIRQDNSACLGTRTPPDSPWDTNNNRILWHKNPR
jgi:hypothetical protein